MIYVPEKENYKCYVVQNGEVIRGYEDFPSYNSTIRFRDYYIRSGYIYKDGEQSFGNYYGNLPVCLSMDTLTSDYHYRLDFDKTLVIFIIFVIIGIYMPIKLVSRIIKRGRL